MDAYANAVSRYLFVQGWQIAFLAIVVGAISYALRHKSAHVRYLLWLVVLAKCLMPPIYSVPVAVLPEDSSEDWLAQFMPSDFSAMSVGDLESSSAAPPVAKGQAVESVAPTPEPTTRPTLSRAEVAVLVWLAGVCVFLLWVGGRTVRCTFWLRPRRQPLAPDQEQAFRELLEGLKFKTLPRIYLTREIGQPFVWGLFRGSVYLPDSFTDLDDPQQCRTILSHELGHVARFDTAVNLLQVLIQAVYWFHPLVWWVNRKIRVEQEKCCDEMAVAQLELSPERYTSAIVEALAQERRSTHRVPSLAIVGSLRDIEERIRTMMRPGRDFQKRPSIIAAVTVLSLALLTVPTALVLTSRVDAEASAPSDQISNVSPSEEVQETPSSSPHQAAEEGDLAPTFVKMWPEVPASWYLRYPCGPAVDSSGNVYVADMYNSRIQKFTSDGKFITRWGTRGDGDGQFHWPSDVALDALGNVYVLDAAQNRIQKFTSDGKFTAKWGSEGSGDGQFNQPWFMAMDASDNMYVADMSNHRIQKFTSDGKFIMKWGSEGGDEGQFSYPSGVAADKSGNIYVADSSNNRLQKFTSDGKFITQWGNQGSGDGEFFTPGSVAVDSSGNVHVVDKGNHRVQKFTSDGKFIAKWGSKGSGEGQFNRPTGIAVDRFGHIYLADRARIQVFNSDGSFITKWGSSGSGQGEFSLAMSVAVDESGNIYVADTYNNSIQKFTSDGGFITTWGSEGSGEGQFRGPLAVAVDNSGNVCVAEARNHRIQKFTSDGKFITKWGSQGSDEGQFAYPWGMAVDASGNVYIADNLNHCIQNFTTEGTFIAKWGREGSGEGQFNRPTGIAVDRFGHVYVADSLNHRIQKFTSDGHFIVKWGSPGSDEGQFSSYLRVAVDDSGNVYVADIENNRIQKFSPSR